MNDKFGFEGYGDGECVAAFTSKLAHKLRATALSEISFSRLRSAGLP